MSLIYGTADKICHESTSVWPQTPLLSSSLYNYKVPILPIPIQPPIPLSESLPMAAITVAISSVKTECAKAAVAKAAPPHSSLTRGARGKMVKVRASMRENVMKMAATSAASVAIAGSALVGPAAAMEVLLGGNGGELAFVPKEFSVAPGETIVFKNNAGFPHNVIFDEDGVPAGVDVGTISMPEEDLLNAPGQTYKVTLDKKGTYRFYCAPHEGAGMFGTVTVN